MTAERSGLSPLKQALVAIEDLRARLAAAEGKGREPVAVVGIGCRLPGGVQGPDDLWRLLCTGVDTIREVPAERWSVDQFYDADPEAPGKAYTRWGGFLDSVDHFDPLLFGLSPREAVNMDPQQRLLLEVSWEALENAGMAPDRMGGTRTGVFTGICSGDYQRLSPHTADPRAINSFSASGMAHSIASGRVAYVLGLQGPALSIDTACSSSLVAIHLAVQSLRAGDCNLALAGGVHVMLAPDNTILFCKSKMMSPKGRCKTFSDDADGFVLGEGAAILVLKRLADALAEGDRIHAVIRGTAVNQDGASGGLTVPSGRAQEDVIRAAVVNAGVDSADVTYVEAHGTGTTLGDPIEVRALASALGGGARPASQPLLLGSLKTNFGHLEAAAGVTGLLKAVLAVSRGEIPAHLHAATLSSHIPWDELPVEVAREKLSWPDGRPRVAGVSAFGFSGTNAHVVVSAPPEVDANRSTTSERPAHVLALSGRTEATVREVAGRLARAVEAGAGSAADVAFTANAGRAHLAHRRAVLFRESAELLHGLRSVADGEEGAGVVSGSLQGSDPPRIVFLFTGQGAQYSGMGRSLYETQPVFRDALDACARILEGELDRPLLQVLWDAGEPIDQTGYTQPALFAVEYALAVLWRSFGVAPAAVVGHSVGEYVAACIAGVLELREALSLVAARGRLMQALPVGGTMAAVATDETRVREAIAGSPLVSIAAVNGPTNTVISGPITDVETIVASLLSGGVKSNPLTVSHAFHSPLMDPILDEFSKVASACSYASPQIPLVSNVTGEAFRGDRGPDAAYWTRHLREAVRFKDSVEWLHGKGYRLFLEIGPAPILGGMAHACLGDDESTFLPSLRKGRDDWDTLLRSLAQLYVRGARVDWRGFDAPYPRNVLTLPTYPFERRRYWFDTVPTVPRPAAVEPGAHPLLGSRLRAATSKDAIFEREMSGGDPAFLEDHRVHGLAVCPATAYLEMALAAAGRAGAGESCSIRGLTIDEALAFPDGAARAVQTVIASEMGERTVRIFSAPARSDEWRLHAAGQLGPVAGPTTSDSLSSIRERCQRAFDIPGFYAGLEARGLSLGGRFRGLSDLARGEAEAIGRIEAPASIRDVTGYGFHPALLDACVQVLAGAVPGAEGGAAPIYMPLAIDDVSIYRSVPLTVWSHARVRPGRTPETLVGDVTVYDEAGTLVASLRGIALKKATAAALHRTGGRAGRLADLLYEVAWREERSTSAGRVDVTALPDPEQVLAGSDARFASLAAEHGFDAYARVEPELEQAVAGYVVRALHALGWSSRDRVEAEDGLLERLGVTPRHRRAFHRLLVTLEGLGLLRRLDAGWQFTGATQPLNPDKVLANLCKEYPAFRAEFAFTARFGPSLAGVLRGEVDPLHLLFPEASLADAEELYLRSAGALTYNNLVAESVGRCLASLPGNVRVLEIGGGTGGTTAALLPRLDPARTEYVFTDVSPLFAAQAQERFAAFPFLRTRSLDMEKDPASQGFEGERFELIVAANVLHATKDLASTFARVRQLLAPGGLLVMIEVTRPQAWLDLTFGLTEGWWHFTDSERRPDYPLLSRQAWSRFLVEEAGFASVEATPGSKSAREPIQAVFVAQEPSVAHGQATEARGPRRGVLVFADATGVADGLSLSLAGAGSSVVVVRSGTGFDVRGREIVIDPRSREDYVHVLDEIGVPDTVVHLWSLDAAAPETLAGLDRAVERSTGSLLLLTHALLERGGPRPPRLVVVTRGAQSVDETLKAPHQSPAWGFVKSLRLEHPELSPMVIDLAPSGQSDEIEVLLAEVLSSYNEEQVALRPGRRLVARLVRGHVPTLEPSKPWELAIGTRGLLENLAVRETQRREPGPREVEIEVRSIGLNFRDVLSALDLYPGTPPPFGSESAGRIVSVGDGVVGLSEGDDVIVVAPGSFRSHLVADVGLVVPKPPTLSYEEAATVAVPFITAVFCLDHVAQLRIGERVLIHAAAGGVGLAAIQVARRAGAEVFATAGSETKRAYLRSLGVEHVMDSRSGSFVQEVRNTTGGLGVDVVLNSLAASFVEASFSVLANAGRFVEIGKRDIWDAEQARRVRPDAGYTIVDWGESAREDPALIRGILEDVMVAFAGGVFRSLPRTAFALEATESAFRTMAQARHTGKIVVNAPRTARPFEIRGEGAYLVTGAFGGLGLRTAQWLVEGGAKDLVLVGRRAPSSETVEAIGKLQESGARVAVHVADVTDEAAMAAVFESISQPGPSLRGIVHSAGALDDGLVRDLDWSRFRTVLGPKVHGAWILHRLSLGQPLDFFVLYSSIASLLGSPGQTNHSSANAFLDALAAHRRSVGLPALSINWGVWDDIGAAARRGSGDRAAARGISGFSPAEGFDALEALMSSKAAQVGVVAVDWPAFLGRHGAGEEPAFFSDIPRAAEGTAAPKATANTLADRLRDVPEANRPNIVAQIVTDAAFRVLGLDPSQGLDTRRPLQELGLDSLMAVELRNDLAASVGRGLPATLLFDYPTVDGIVGYLVTEVLKLKAPATAAAQADRGRPSSANAVDAIEDMSDEEVEALLARKRGR